MPAVVEYSSLALGLCTSCPPHCCRGAGQLPASMPLCLRAFSELKVSCLPRLKYQASPPSTHGWEGAVCKYTRLLSLGWEVHVLHQPWLQDLPSGYKSPLFTVDMCLITHHCWLLLLSLTHFPTHLLPFPTVTSKISYLHSLLCIQERSWGNPNWDSEEITWELSQHYSCYRYCLICLSPDV